MTGVDDLAKWYGAPTMDPLYDTKMVFLQHTTYPNLVVMMRIAKSIEWFCKSKQHRWHPLPIPKWLAVIVVTVVEAVDSNAELTTVKFEKPAPKGAVTLVSPDNLDELINLLHNEAKVI